jgi:ketosteroid isomerase-like protein
MLALLGGCGWFGGDLPSNTQDLAAIEALNQQYLAAINNADIDALNALTTESQIMFAPNRAPVAGKAENVAAWQSLFEQFEIEEAWMPGETALGGDWAWQRGRFRVTATARNGGEPQTSTGHYLRILARQPDGTWRIAIDMFSGDGSTSD